MIGLIFTAFRFHEEQSGGGKTVSVQPAVAAVLPAAEAPAELKVVSAVSANPHALAKLQEKK